MRLARQPRAFPGKAFCTSLQITVSQPGILWKPILRDINSEMWIKARVGGGFICRWFGKRDLNQAGHIFCLPQDLLEPLPGKWALSKRRRSISEHTSVAHLSVAARIWGWLTQMPEIHGGGFQGGEGVVRSKRITRTAGKVPGERKGQELDLEALLNSRPFQPGRE